MTEPDAYAILRRKLLWAFPTGLYLLGSHLNGQVHVMTTSWVMQVATTPKMIACSVEQNSKSLEFISGTGTFSISILPKSQRSTIRKYVKRDQRQEMVNGNLTIEGNSFLLAESGNPYLEAGVGFLEAQLVTRTDFESHAVLFGEISDCLALTDIKDVLDMHDTLMNYGG